MANNHIHSNLTQSLWHEIYTNLNNKAYDNEKINMFDKKVLPSNTSTIIQKPYDINTTKIQLLQNTNNNN